MIQNPNSLNQRGLRSQKRPTQDPSLFHAFLRRLLLQPLRTTRHTSTHTRLIRNSSQNTLWHSGESFRATSHRCNTLRALCSVSLRLLHAWSELSRALAYSWMAVSDLQPSTSSSWPLFVTPSASGGRSHLRSFVPRWNHLLTLLLHRLSNTRPLFTT
jgi:hypothetical protein